MRHIVNNSTYFTRLLLLPSLALMLFFGPAHVSLSQRVYVTSSPDAAEVIYDHKIMEEFFFDQSLIDSMKQAFYNVPGASTFAVHEQINYNPGNSGVIVKNKAGERVWYLRLRSVNAKSLNVIFNKFIPAGGEKLFVYDIDLETVRGPYTYLNRSKMNMLPVTPVPGDDIVIEYHLRAGNEGERIELGRLAHDFIGVVGKDSTKDVFYGDSQSCNVDINCESGADWQKEKNSVVRIIAGGVELGSGFMLNNTNQANIPYVITANHVIETEFLATNSIFFFRYESPYCDGPDGIAQYTLSGSELMAKSENLDFTIVRLEDFPPITYKPYFAGWDVRFVIPDSSTGIHHPSGDVKKISTDGDPPGVDTFQELIQNGFWKIVQWDEGTTEGGSSGSPLFNQDHRVIGLLVGGEAVCGRSVNDYYTRMDLAHDLYDEMTQSLLPWLDPARSGDKVWDGRDPYSENTATFDTLNNCDGDKRYLTEYDLPGTGYTTGYNSDSLVMYAEKFFASPGDEICEIIFGVGDSRYIDNNDSITVFIMDGITEPASVIARRTLYIRDALDSTKLYFDFLEPVAVPEDFFIAWHLWYKDEAASEQQQLALLHGEALSVSQNTAYFKDIANWYPFYEHPYGADPLSLCVQVIVSDNTVYNSVDDIILPGDDFLLYPNPVSDILRVKARNNTPGKTNYKIFNMSGQKVLDGYIHLSNAGSEAEINLSSLKTGIYYISFETGSARRSYKIIRNSQ
ncbi:MAG: T9SS type A sorting domain-containing protein [Bacteroidales bacterium]|nr:T9SS type A sorting domain-containing protein [Bacteroidales bacterium]